MMAEYGSNGILYYMNKPVKKTSASIQGSILITALCVVAIAVTLSTAILITTKQFIRSSQLQIQHSQDQAYIDSGLNWVKVEIDQYHKLPIERKRRLPLRLEPAFFDSGKMMIEIHDAQARLNINNLAPNEDLALYQKIYVALFQLELGLSSSSSEALVKAIIHLRHSQSQPFFYIEELLKVPGFKKAYLEKLKPYIIALPETTTLNLNTVSGKLLQIILQDPELIHLLLTESEKGIRKMPNSLLEKKPLESKAFGVDTSYFIAFIKLEHPDYHFTEKILLSGQGTQIRTLMSIE